VPTGTKRLWDARIRAGEAREPESAGAAMGLAEDVAAAQARGRRAWSARYAEALHGGPAGRALCWGSPIVEACAKARDATPGLVTACWGTAFSLESKRCFSAMPTGPRPASSVPSSRMPAMRSPSSRCGVAQLWRTRKASLPSAPLEATGGTCGEGTGDEGEGAGIPRITHRRSSHDAGSFPTRALVDQAK